MSTQQHHDQTDYSDLELHECAKALVRSIETLRSENDFDQSQPVSVYVTDKPIIRSMLKEHREYITDKANAADLVQMNLDANMPIPAHAPQQDFEIGGQTIRVAIDRD